MKPNKTFTDYLKPDEPDYVQERIVCGINALIETLKLPVTKLTDNISTSIISIKLREITGDNFNLRTSDGQAIQLHFAIIRICPDEETADRVMELSEEKFLHYKKTRSFI